MIFKKVRVVCFDQFFKGDYYYRFDGILLDLFKSILENVYNLFGSKSGAFSSIGRNWLLILSGILILALILSTCWASSTSISIYPCELCSSSSSESCPKLIYGPLSTAVSCSFSFS